MAMGSVSCVWLAQWAPGCFPLPAARNVGATPSRVWLGARHAPPAHPTAYPMPATQRAVSVVAEGELALHPAARAFGWCTERFKERTSRHWV